MTRGSKQDRLGDLLMAVEEACRSWHWWPETEFGTTNAMILSSAVVNLEAAFDAYVEWEEESRRPKGEAVKQAGMAGDRVGWDCYFLSIAEAVAARSTCLSRRVGCVIVRDRSILSTGYNGPPRGVPHCDPCPREEAGYPSGEGLHMCPATHAEVNALAQAARNGVSVLGATLYLSSEGVQPCKSCSGAMINAGIREIVGDRLRSYDDLTSWILAEGGVVLRPPYQSDPPLGGFGMGCK